MIENEKNLVMYFHTTLRNIFVMISLSFGGLSYSRYFREGTENFIYNIGLVIFSIIILFLSLYTTKNIICDINRETKNNDEYKIIFNLKIIPQVIMYIIVTLLGFATYTFIREMRKFNSSNLVSR